MSLSDRVGITAMVQHPCEVPPQFTHAVAPTTPMTGTVSHLRVVGQ